LFSSIKITRRHAEEMNKRNVLDGGSALKFGILITTPLLLVPHP
jgi:hypothetical protein